MIPLMKGTTTLLPLSIVIVWMQMIPLMKGTTTVDFIPVYHNDANDPINEGNYNIFICSSNHFRDANDPINEGNYN